MPSSSSSAPFLHGYFWLVEFRTVAASAAVFSPDQDGSFDWVIQDAADKVLERYGLQVGSGEVARIHGPFPLAAGIQINVTEHHLQDPEVFPEPDDWRT